MAIYRCAECCVFIDDDYDPGVDAEEFNERWKGEMVCPSCVEDLEDDD